MAQPYIFLYTSRLLLHVCHTMALCNVMGPAFLQHIRIQNEAPLLIASTVPGLLYTSNNTHKAAIATLVIDHAPIMG